MTDFTDTSRSMDPEDTGLEKMHNDALQTHDEMGDNELIMRGITILDRGRRGTRHKIIILGGTAADRRIEE